MQLAVFVATVIIGLATRWWLVAGRAPSWWQDSDDYLAVGRHSVASSELWLGARPPLIPLLLGATGGRPGHGFMVAQTVIAALCWAWLASELAVRVRDLRLAWCGAVAVIGLSLTWPVAMWDRSVLTESLGLSLLAAVTAAGLRFSARRGRASALVLVGTSVLWASTRDTVAVVLVAGALTVGLAQLRGRRDALVLAVAGLVLLSGGAAATAATRSHRDLVPLSHVYFARLLPYPERVRWLGDHGMPQADQLYQTARTVQDDGIHAPVVAPGADDPAYASWWAWLRADGFGTFHRYVATHPWYLASEPAQHPERAYNNADGRIAFYRPVDMPKVPMTTALFWPSTLATVFGLGALGALWRRRRLATSPLLVTAGCLVAGAAAYTVVAWHSDGMEPARHLILSDVMARLALLLGLVAMADSRLARRDG